jgi:hypothetical protein
MAAVENKKKNREHSLQKLTSIPFDAKNQAQINSLKSYLSEFEFCVSQMYLYQAMSTGLTAWGGSWIVGFFLPIPDFAKYFLTAGLYLGISGYVLEQFSTNDFYDQLKEMKTLYNWCLKAGQLNYQPSKDNSDQLALPEIQRMIKLMAPLCPKEDLIAWPVEVSREREATSSIGYLFNTLSKLSKAPKSNEKEQSIRQLKLDIERDKFQLGVYDAFTQAMGYFATTEFRTLLTAKTSELVAQPLQNFKAKVSTLIM